MKNVVGVRFKKTGKIYYFDPDGRKIEKGTDVLVETARGIEFGRVMIANRDVEDEQIIQPLKLVKKIADQKDVEKNEENKRKEKDAFNICLEKIKAHKLGMNLIDVEFTFDNNKVLFYFTADGRIDFRELVKDLASVFKTRIELRQIGVRDEAKYLGGIGICGRGLCCKDFLGEFQPVSIKMAKDQGLSLNPTKISGLCGRLMCCLKYEHDVYEEKLNRLPKVGAIVATEDGDGEVVNVDTLREMLKVKVEKDQTIEFKNYAFKDVKIIRDAIIQDDKIELSIEEIKALEDN